MNFDFGSLSVMDIFILVTCIYIFGCGVINKGTIFKDDTIAKDKKQEFHKWIRLLCIIGGLIGVSSILLMYVNGLQVLAWILYVMFLVMVIIMCVLSYMWSKARLEKKQRKMNKE